MPRKCIRSKKVASKSGHRVERCAKYSSSRKSRHASEASGDGRHAARKCVRYSRKGASGKKRCKKYAM